MQSLDEWWLSQLADELDPNGGLAALTAAPLSGSELPWPEWVARYFPSAASFPMAERHERLWNWFDGLRRGEKPRPRVEPWPRGGAKSTTGEMGVVRIGAKLTRRFALFICEGQPQATDHVKTIAGHFERLGVGRAINKYGSSKGWRDNELHTTHGFNVKGLGIFADLRGIRVDEFRPDIIIFDDIDGRHDTLEIRKKKIDIITQTILPAGSADCAVLFLQNLIYKPSIVYQLVEGTAGFLLDRETAEPEPAVRNLSVETYRREDIGLNAYRVIGGEPTWAGQSLDTVQKQINEWGYESFLREAQQEVEEEEGGLWTRQLLHDCRVTSHPSLHRIVVAVDPNATDGGDEAGIIVLGAAKILGIEHGFVLKDATVGGGPKVWAEASVAEYRRWRADALIAEKNNGGDMVAITIGTVPGAPSVKLVHASRGKITRGEPVKKLYSDGRMHHVGPFPDLETEQCTFRPGMPSPNRMDALVWGATELLIPEPPKRSHTPVTPTLALGTFARR